MYCPYIQARVMTYKPVTAYTATQPIYVNDVDINTGLYPVLNFKPEGATYPYIYVPIAEFARVGAKVVWDDANQLLTVETDYYKMKTLLQIAGRWESPNNTPETPSEEEAFYRCFTIIRPTGINTFEIDIEAAYRPPFGATHMGSMSGKGQIMDSKIEFIVDENMRGEIKLQNEKLFINYIGDTSYYAGLNVGFAKEFVRNV
ncbi:hypothetical protein [Acetivibrio cellulolyticus]|uniref:hypothetical protein n=1 Tax=Acetivibrio cellulolyticus TaxID=35830 RepID=UPI0001E2C285|nr:hypothetical protein [Acetivibrio cellulolyticus]